ncbi:MAG: hypothetical protein ACRCVX_12610 [Shewanella sp.]
MSYFYNPYQGIEQFYDCNLPANNTAPVSHWLRDFTGEHFVDVKMPDGHVIRSIFGESVEIYVARGGSVLPDGIAK